MRIGVDPGASDNAAAALLDGHKILMWWAWRSGKRDKTPVYVMTSHAGDETIHFSPYDCAAYIARQIPGRVDVVLEGSFIKRRQSRRNRAQARSTLKLAEATGEIWAGLRPIAKTLERPSWSEWNRAVLGRGNTPKWLAEEYAITQSERYLDWPGDGAVRNRLSLALRVSLAEACCMGVWPRAIVGVGE